MTAYCLKEIKKATPIIITFFCWTSIFYHFHKQNIGIPLKEVAWDLEDETNVLWNKMVKCFKNRIY